MRLFPPFFNRKKKIKSPLATITFNVDHEQEFDHFIHFLSNPWAIAFRNFWAGTFHGVGFLLGTALFLWLLSFILRSVLGEIPFFSDFSSAVDLWLQDTLNQAP